MAPVRRWALAGALGCVAVALAFVPPRGAKPGGRPPIFMQPPRGTPAREHAQELADEWRAADAAVHLLAARRDLARRMRAARDSNRSLVVVGDSAGVLIAPPRIVDSAAHLAWRELGLGETKIAVALVVQLTVPIGRRDRPLIEEGIAAYLGPDSTDRTTCIALSPAGSYWTRYLRGDLAERLRAPFRDFIQSMKAGFGPCAFYAAFGTPSKTVRGWLRANDWVFALVLNPGPRDRGNSLYSVANARYAWYWDAIYSLPPHAVACLASRAEDCRAVVLAGMSDDPSIPVPDIMRVQRRYWAVPRLVEGGRFLGDVTRAIGRDRFLSFWTSPQRVDTALALALKQPVGEWTAAWQRDFVPPIRLGPLPPLGGLGTGFAIGALAVAIVTAAASRRQVR